MRVFVTGATGFIGSAVVADLLGGGHQVTGLARSAASAASLAAAGAGVLRGCLADLDSLRRGAAESDGVIHTAYTHDFSANNDAAAYARTDRSAIEAIGGTLAGSGRPLVVASPMPEPRPGQVISEADRAPDNPAYPRVSEPAAMSLAGRGVSISVVRMPQSVHGRGDHAFIPALIAIARAKGRSAYVASGSNHWAAVHRLDAARLFRLAVESAPAGALLNAVADEGIEFREIAEAIGRHLGLPAVSVSREQAREHFGLLGVFASMDVRASSELTRKQLGWYPAQTGLIADLGEGHYFTS